MPAAAVAKPRNRDWTRDELIIALNFYVSATHGQSQEGSKRVAPLSALLNRLYRKL
jgi:hypothetical protein